MSFSGLWVFKDDLMCERCFGVVVVVDSGVISIEVVEVYLLEIIKDEKCV